MAKSKEEVTSKSAVTKKINEKKSGFDLSNYKKTKHLNQTAKFKKQEWLQLSPAFQEALSVPGIPLGHIVLYRGHSDTGKAQPLSSNVLTPEGFVKMGDIKAGDKIMGVNGNTQKVLAVYPQGIRPVYKVTFDDDSIVYCDEEHIWSVNPYGKRHSHEGKRDDNGKRPYKSDLSFVNMTAKEMFGKIKQKQSKGTTNNYMIPVCNAINFVKKSDLPIDPYTLGLFLGDGTIGESVNISTKDDPITESMQYDSFYRKTDTIHRNNRSIYKINFKMEIKEHFKDMGLYGKYSEEKFIPENYIYQATVEDRLALVQGLLDSDGTCNRFGTVEYSTSSEKLKDGFVELIRSLGGVTKVRSQIPWYTYKGERKQGLRNYTVTVRLPHELVPFRLERKLSRVNKNRKPIRRYIKDISYSHDEECQCILVSNKDHLYITDNYVATHNTTAMIETAIAAQKAGKLPVFIITEMKWSWSHVKTMGFEVNEIVDQQSGEINYDGDFIYIDRGALNTIEDIAAFISDLLDEQAKGLIPLDMVFLWDSAGSIPCEMSYSSKKNNAMWNAGAMATQFGNFINQRITLSRKDTSPYTNTLIVVNKIRVEYPIGNIPGAQPKLKNKGGDCMFWDATYVFTFGNVTGPGTVKVKATKDGKEVEWAKIVRVTCDKNHMNGVSTTGKIITTPHGFIHDKDKEKYKKLHRDEWAKVLGSDDFDIIEEEDTTQIQAINDEE